MIIDDRTIIHFNSSKVQASLSANTFVIISPAEAKSIIEMLPEILSHLGTNSLTHPRKFDEQFPKQVDSKAPTPEDTDDDEGVSDLLENFYEASNNEAK